MRKKFLSAFMLGALTLTATSTFVSCKDYDGDISAIKNDVTALQNQLNTLKTNLEGLQAKHNQDIATLTTQLNDAKTALQAAIDTKADKTVVAALADRVAGLETRMATAETKIGEINEALKTLEEKKADKTALQALADEINGKLAIIDGKIVTIEGDIVKVNGRVDEVKTDLATLKGYCEDNFELQKKAIEACEGRLDDLEKMLADYPEVKAQVAQNKADIAALLDRVNQAELDIKANASAIEELQGAVIELNNAIAAVEGRVSVLEVLVNKRLTSLVFQPTTFIDGVEAINFASLEYKDWNQGAGQDVANNWLADAAAGKVDNRIDDGTAEAVYYINPSSADASSIEGGIAGLKFIESTADNILTSKAADGVKVSVVAEGSKIENGKLTLKLTKNTKAINNSNNDFTMIALKAPVAEDMKTADEKGQDINVYSDWARLQETVVTPYIHDARVIIGEENAHFNAFSDVYAQGQGTKAVHYTGYTKDFVNSLTKEAVAYDKSLDLKPLVCVCDKDGNRINAAAYGLSFEFRMLDEFNVLDGGATTTYTNQQKYATVTADGVLTPQAVNAAKGNRDAIDKTPVVQVILRDNANNAVVDVRYIVVLVTETTIEPKPIGITVEGEDIFDCGNAYDVFVSSDDMNQMAALLNLSSGLEFTTLYHFGSELYAADGTVIGTVTTKTHGGAEEQANNLIVTFDASNVVLDDDLYYNGTKEVVGCVKIYNLYNQYAYYLPVSLTVKFAESRQNKYIPGYGRESKYWKGEGADGYVVVNPTLRSNMDDPNTDYDASGMLDTQLIYNIMNAYSVKGESATDMNDVVTNLDPNDGDKAWLELDEARMKAVTGMDLYFDEHEQYQILKEKGTNKFVAILWKTTGKFQLWENAQVDDNVNVATQEIKGAGKHGVPSELAKKLVSFSLDTEVANRFNGIPVMVKAQQCGHIVTIDQFIVRFEKPLTFAWNSPVFNVKDQWDEGSSKTISWDKWFTLKEAFGRERSMTGVDAVSVNLRKWYGLQLNDNPACTVAGHSDKANWIHPHVQLEKAHFEGDSHPLSYYKDMFGNPKYTLTYSATHNDAKYGSDATFTFYNNSGNAITETLKIIVPVQVATKWDTTFGGEIVVVVEETTKTAK